MTSKILEHISGRIAAKVRSEWAFSVYKKDAPSLLWTWKRHEAQEGDVQNCILEGLRQDKLRIPGFLGAFMGEAYNSEGIPVRADFGRRSYDVVKSLVDPEIINQLVMEAFGDRIELGKFYFDEEVPIELAICNQFVSIHQLVSKEGPADSTERPGETYENEEVTEPAGGE